MFRRLIVERDRRCRITGKSPEECSACHIIPKNVCWDLLPDMVADIRNGFLMTETFHRLFDKFKWTFDIYDVQLDDQGGIKCRIIVLPTRNNLSIHDHAGTYISMPVESWVFLYVHYQVFIAVNYLGINPTQVYHHVITGDPVFRYLVEGQVSVPIESLASGQFTDFLVDHGLVKVDSLPRINAIIGHQRGHNLFLTWWDHLPLSSATMEPEHNLGTYNVGHYLDLVESDQDPDFSLKN